MTSAEYGYTDAKLVPSSLIGYRAWKPVIHAPGLRAYVRDYVWLSGINHAKCIGGRIDHSDASDFQRAAPQRECSCGFYGRLIDNHHGYDVQAINGVVEVTGQVVLGTHGFRAERAEIKALYRTPHSTYFFNAYPMQFPWARNYEDALEELSLYYTVPVFNSFEEAKEEFPPSDVSELMPEGTPKPIVEPNTPCATAVLSVDGRIIRVVSLDPAGNPTVLPPAITYNWFK